MIGGLVALAALPLLLFGVVRRRRQLRRLRAELRDLDDRQAYLLAATAETRDSWAEIVGPRPSRPPVYPPPGAPRRRPQGPPVYPPPAHSRPVPPVYPPAGVAAPPPVATRPLVAAGTPANGNSGPPAHPPAHEPTGTPPPATAAARRRIRV